MNGSQTDILLESGTNEIEIFEFILNDQSYGINALKISEAVEFKNLTVSKVPNTEDAFLGTALFRGAVTRVIDLRVALNIPIKANNPRPIILFCEFNRTTIGFLVDDVKGIHRISWKNVQSPSQSLNSRAIIGFAIIDDTNISMLDFESIILSLFGMNYPERRTDQITLAENFKILAADDSPLFRKKVVHSFKQISAQNYEIFENGAQLYDRFAELHAKNEPVHLVITDLEMPQMDGFSCCKKIKSLNSRVPIVILSSLINDQIARKCTEVGANESINKSDFDELTNVIKKYYLQN